MLPGPLLGAPPIGRERELRTLREAFDLARQERRARLVALRGDPGVGKSRLADELAASLDDAARSIRARCRPDARGATFQPLTDAVHEAVGIAPDESAELVRARIMRAASGRWLDPALAALGLSDELFTVEETFESLGELVQSLAGKAPLLLVFDDLEYAEPTFLDFLGYLGRAVEGAAVLVLCVFGDESVTQAKASLGRRATWVDVDPLDTTSARQLAEKLAESASLAPERLARLVEATEGNPLHIEEALLNLIEASDLDGAGVSSQDFSRTATSDVESAIAARLERLGPVERSVLERAAVLGGEFTGEAITALGKSDARDPVDATLDLLLRRELLRPGERGLLEGKGSLRFRHDLIREIAYESTAGARRAALHERCAALLEIPEGRFADSDAIVGWHLEQAALDEGVAGGARNELAGRAGARLGATGSRALARGDLSAAVDLFDRAAALGGGALAPDLLLQRGLALSEAGELDAAEDALDDAERAARAKRSARVELNAVLERSDVRASSSPKAAGELRAVAQRSIPLLWELRDEPGLARAWRNLSDAHCFACRYGAAAEALERALEHARRAGERNVESQILYELSMVLVYGPAPAEGAIERLETALDRAHSRRRDPDRRSGFATRALVEGFGLARLQAMRGQFGTARELCDAAREVFTRLGHGARVATLGLVAGQIELLAGEPLHAEREFRSSYERLARLGGKEALATAAAELAEAHLALGRDGDADALCRESERDTTSQDVLSAVSWRRTRARLHVGKGDLQRAEKVAREAVSLAEATDFPNVQADALIVLAEVLEAANNATAASSAATAAVKRYEQKGNLASAHPARAWAEIVSS